MWPARAMPRQVAVLRGKKSDQSVQKISFSWFAKVSRLVEGRRALGEAVRSCRAISDGNKTSSSTLISAKLHLLHFSLQKSFIEMLRENVC